MPLQKFAWKDRDTVARDMMQLVYHGPQHVRHIALEVLQSIRSTAIALELKALALDTDLSYQDRSDALNTLAACPGDISIEELAPFVKASFDGRWHLVQEARNTSTFNLDREQLFSEYWMLMSIFKVVSSHPINRSWFFELLEQTTPALRCDVLCEAINATCQQELEPILMGRLEALMEQYPELLTLRTANEIANHGDDEPPKFLMDHIDKVISLCLEGSENEVSSVLSYSPALTAKVAETHLELAKLSSLFPYLHLHGPNAVPPPAPIEPPPPKLWQQMEQLYQKAASGDETAFQQLHELSDDYQMNVLIQAAATYFLGKLWPHDYILDRLGELVIDGDRTWDIKHEMYTQTYTPVRFEAAYALRETATPQAWEVLINLVFLRPHYSMSDQVMDWIRELTDILSGDSHDGETSKYRWAINDRPWIREMTKLSDDLEDILKTL